MLFRSQSYISNLRSPENRGVPDIALESSRYLVLSTIPGLSNDGPETYYVMSSTGCATNVRLCDSYSPPSFFFSALPILEYQAEPRYTDCRRHLLAA